MMNMHGLSKREMEVAQLLLEGKSNKQIAVALDISNSTVEFHLTNIYAKLGIASRTEAIIRLAQLWKSPGNGKTGGEAGGSEIFSGESPVANADVSANNTSDLTLPAQEMPKMTRRTGQLSRKSRIPIAIGIILALIGIFVIYLLIPKSWSKYERECEHPDANTVGQAIARSNASGSTVHGQFGTTSAPPWPALAGSVTYKNISTPKVDPLYLKVRYSKNSPSSVPILVYLDGEKNPRAAFYPKDQGNWNQFAWTDSIYLGSIESGVHSIGFATDGQKFGVADLDKFVLTRGSP